LIAACTPISDDPLSSLYYPPNLPLTTSLEISNHPIIDAVRSTLFPFLPIGNYLTALRDKLDVIPSTRYMCTQPPSALLNDGRVATINIILPVRFRGGALVIRDPDASEERYLGRGGKSGDMEWSAYLPECEYEVEPVQKGCKLAISYGLYLRTFGPAGVHPEPLITPSDNFLDLFSPIFNTMRGRQIAFYLINDYGVDPSDVLAESLVPHVRILPSSISIKFNSSTQLKGGDSLLYHAIKVYKLIPELRWTAGGYIWPVDRSVDWDNNEDVVPAVRGMFASTTDDHGIGNIRSKLELSGAIPLADTGIVVLTDWDAPRSAGKERAPFVSAGKLEKLVVNVLLVAFVP
jgi:hypothetical protein